MLPRVLPRAISSLAWTSGKTVRLAGGVDPAARLSRPPADHRVGCQACCTWRATCYSAHGLGAEAHVLRARRMPAVGPAQNPGDGAENSPAGGPTLTKAFPAERKRIKCPNYARGCHGGASAGLLCFCFRPL